MNNPPKKLTPEMLHAEAVRMEKEAKARRKRAELQTSAFNLVAPLRFFLALFVLALLISLFGGCG